MSTKKFKFVSPGIFLSEIDNSQLPAQPEEMGPVIIGRTAFGPTMRPVKVNSFSEFVQIFGNPVPGQEGGDTWRVGNLAGPTYAAYAAQAYLRAGVGPVTMMRLGGLESDTAVDGGYAGWQTDAATASATSSSNGGAYGLYLTSGSLASGGAPTGSLAAIFYVNDGGGLVLTGTLDTGSTTATGSQGLFATSSDGAWKMLVLDDTGTTKLTTEFNFERTSNKFIRNVFNTNPMLVNDGIINTSSLKQGQSVYWLGESFENFINNSTINYTNALLVPLQTGTLNRAAMQRDSTAAASGWFFAQDLTTDSGSYTYDKMQKLFKIHSLDGGEWSQNNLKISIKDIRFSRNTDLANAYGSFTVVVRRASDTDNLIQIVEQFSNCNLNPASDNYIATKIGDRYPVWDTAQLRLKELGQFNNKSEYIRVEMNSDVGTGLTDSRLLPYGVYGPDKLLDITLASSSVAQQMSASSSCPFIDATSYLGLASGTLSVLSCSAVVPASQTMLLQMPRIATRRSASDGGLGNPKDAYFGVNSSYGTTSRFNAGYGDLLRAFPEDAADCLDSQFVFSLDDIVTSGSTTAFYSSGSRAEGSSSTAQSDDGWQGILDAGYNRFTAPLFGGFDGVDIREMEPFRNSLMGADTTEQNSYVYNTIKRAIDTVSDPEFVECNMITMPGLTNEGLTNHIVTTCEDRADALALIDLEDTYYPFTEGLQYASFNSRIPTVREAVTALEDRQINSSYGCA